MILIFSVILQEQFSAFSFFTLFLLKSANDYAVCMNQEGWLAVRWHY
ncbi:MAG: hypothetical protein LBT89_09900 [Planctomycetaceae bacterium]|nr:hypothetical protein [Planctomycetaceae bacterium]